MAEGGKGGGNAGLAFIVGGLLVVVAVMAWFLFSGGAMTPTPQDRDVDINVELPELPQVEPPANPLPAPPAPERAPSPSPD